MLEFSLEAKVTLIRTAGLFLPILLSFGLLNFKPIDHRQIAGLFLSFLWCFCSLFVINFLAVYYGLWTYNVEGGVFARVPVDLIIGWSILWAIVPNILAPKMNVLIWSILFLIIDVVAMPLLEPVIVLNKDWWVAEGLCILLSFYPAKTLFNLTAENKRLGLRSFLQMLLYTMLVFVILPLSIVENTGGSTIETIITFFDHMNAWFIQLLFLFSVLGFSALQEFITKGKGTPFPLDPAEKLMTTGAYAYVKNPMQLTQLLLLSVLSLILLEPWIFGAGLMSVIYSLGIGLWSESRDMRERFGELWIRYEKGVRNYFPRWLPWREKEAIIYMDLNGCGVCTEMSEWIKKMNPKKLQILDAKHYPGQFIHRMTYVDDSYEVEGVTAVARVLEHVNLGWAFLGFFLRLLVVKLLAQILLDGIIPPRRVLGAMKN